MQQRDEVFLLAFLQQAFSCLIPRILEVIKGLALQDEEQACDSMEIFDSLVECEVAILHPHVRTIVEYCLRVSEALLVERARFTLTSGSGGRPAG